MRLAAVLGCLLLGSCNQARPDGSEVLSQVAAALQEGDGARAKELLADPPLIETAYLDYNGPQYCSKEGADARLNDAGWDAARRLVAIYEEEKEAVARYAAAEKTFDEQLEQYDGFIELMCSTDMETRMAHESARTPLATAMKLTLEPMGTAAQAQAGGPEQLERATRKALAATTARKREEHKQSCRELREEREKPSYETTPLIEHAQKLRMQSCEAAGF